MSVTLKYNGTINWKNMKQKKIKKNTIKNPKWLENIIGKKILGFEYGPDADGDPHIYYIQLDGNIKIGIARITEDDIVSTDRSERLEDGTIIRFNFILPGKRAEDD